MKKTIFTLIFLLVFNVTAFSETIELVTFDYYPTMYIKDNKLKGCAIDIVKEAFKRMNQKISIKMVPMKRGQHMLKDGEIDGMFTLYKTAERTQYAYYPDLPVLSRVISFYVKSDSPITFDGDIKKMQKYSIGTVLGYSYGKELDNYLKSNSFKQIDKTAELENTVNKLVLGRFDILPHTKLDMIHLLKKMKFENKVKQLTPSIAELPVYLAFTKKKKNLIPIANKFSESILKMKEEGVYEKLLYNLE